MKSCKICRVFLIVAFVCSSLFLVGCSFDDNTRKNDREYSISEVAGNYYFERYNRGTTYEYTLVIDANGNAKLDRKSYTWEGKRAGVYWEDSYGSGDVKITKSSITIISYEGYIENGNIYIGVDGYVSEFKKIS